MNINSISDQIREEISKRLDAIEINEGVKILFAIESGSRAWGFPSPDSDYDVRFVYTHEPDWYLSIDTRRDVIELPIEGDLDINGWDLRKALQLLIKPNPVLLEWLCSPIIYRADETAMEKITELAQKTAHQRPSLYHYLHLAETQYRRFIKDKKTIPIKKYFYSLRPTLALIWLRTNPNLPVPMAFPVLRAGIKLPTDVSEFLDELLKKKAQTRELGDGLRHEKLDELIESEIRLAKSSLAGLPHCHPELLSDANILFRDLVKQFDRG